jgi:hypothetical protein
MIGRVLLILPMVWVSISSSVCQAACVLAEEPVAADRAAAAAAPHAGCEHHDASDIPPANRPDKKDAHLDCCCLAMGAPALDTNRGLPAEVGALVHVIVDTSAHVDLLLQRDVDHAPRPPGLNSPFARNNPHLLI